jgi:hypothetical protein
MSDWGKGVNNNIGWGQGADNNIGWGSIYDKSNAGDTLLGGGGSDFTPPNKMTIESVELTNDTTKPNKMTIESVELT